MSLVELLVLSGCCLIDVYPTFRVIILEKARMDSYTFLPYVQISVGGNIKQNITNSAMIV
jgi:hypothetical protein